MDTRQAKAAESQSGRRRLIIWLLIGAVAFGALLTVSGVTTAYLVYRHLNGNIRTEDVASRLGGQRPSGNGAALNILLIGSDDRSGSNARYGYAEGARSDTTILLHLSPSSKRVTAVSIPRDALVDIPVCALPDGTEVPARRDMFNSAYWKGGMACTIRTVEMFSGLRIDHHVIVDFAGFKRIVDTLGGVEVCLPEPVDDPKSHLRLPAGRSLVTGEQALGFVRARESLGNGSDTQRIGRQQQFLASLVAKLKSGDVLYNPVKLYRLLDAATKSITTDPGLNSLQELYALASKLRDVPESDIVFVTVPRQPAPGNPARDEFVQPDADRLFAALRADEPITGRPGTEQAWPAAPAPVAPDVAGEDPLAPAPVAPGAAAPAAAEPSAPPQATSPPGLAGTPYDGGAPPAPSSGFSTRNAADDICSTV